MEAATRFRLVGAAALMIFILVLLAPTGWKTGTLFTRKPDVLIYNRTMALILVEYASAAYIIDDSSLLSWTCSRCQGITKVCDCANSCQKRFCFVPSLDLHQQFRFLDQI
jgi:hypothetical protein